jgi:hypothetical protein
MFSNTLARTEEEEEAVKKSDASRTLSRTQELETEEKEGVASSNFLVSISRSEIGEFESQKRILRPRLSKTELSKPHFDLSQSISGELTLDMAAAPMISTIV